MRTSVRRYFFDLLEGGLAVPDEIGSEYANVNEIKDHSQRILVELAAVEQFRADGLHAVICVRDESGERIFMATMLIAGNTF